MNLAGTSDRIRDVAEKCPSTTAQADVLSTAAVRDRDESVRRYSRIDLDFPSNSTIDQFLDPQQFVAYVDLGGWVARKALASQEPDDPGAVTRRGPGTDYTGGRFVSVA